MWQPPLVIVLVGVFLASAVAKVTYWESTLDWLAEVAPRRSPVALAVAIVLGELLVAAALVAGPRFGAALAAGWIAGASGVLLLSRKRLSQCGCFGLRQRIGWPVFARNALIVVGALPLVLVGDHYGGGVEPLWSGAVLGASAVALREAVRTTAS